MYQLSDVFRHLCQFSVTVCTVRSVLTLLTKDLKDEFSGLAVEKLYHSCSVNNDAISMVSQWYQPWQSRGTISQ